jgi:hypothetical protein
MTAQTANAAARIRRSVKYPLTSPLVVAGEESPAEASIRERSIELLFSEEGLKPEAHRTAFENYPSYRITLASFGRSLLDAR